MKTSFTFENESAQAQGQDEPDEFLSSEVRYLGGWARKVARRLKHDGSIKMIHQDQLGTVACHMEQDRSGRGKHIEQAAVCHANLLETL